MIKHFPIIIFLILFISCNKKVTQNNPIQKAAISDTIMISENIDYPKIYALEFVANDWNVETYILHSDFPNGVFDSTYLAELRIKNQKKAELHNKAIWEKLDSIKNTNSKQAFRNEVNKEIQRIKESQKILDSNIVVQNFLKETYKTGSFIIPVVHSKINSSELVSLIRVLSK